MAMFLLIVVKLKDSPFSLSLSKGYLHFDKLSANGACSMFWQIISTLTTTNANIANKNNLLKSLFELTYGSVP